MDRVWMREKLQTYLSLLESYTIIRKQHPGTWATPQQGESTVAELRRQEPTVKQVLKRLDPELAEFDFEVMAGYLTARSCVQRGLGVLEDQEEWATRLAPDAPMLPADQFHPWVWGSARTLWESKHYRQAVQTAATAINAFTQTKLGRQDASDKKLMESAFGNPKSGTSRLVVDTSGLAQATSTGMQVGVMSFAVGCFQAIRNPATHEPNEWGQQTALEYLAALSVLARWIDAAKVEIPI